ncbi:hypothetical protein [Aureimonas sp. AU40]|uniref:hypothetical protein n=1 Tax=Aureimonas sp. AU40 TaxID=1637747 RepID=UPI000782C0C0|nr:hypothetical protein [Aureimonas sp. AU40]
MAKRTSSEIRTEKHKKTLLASDREFRVATHLSFRQRIERLEDELKTCLPHEVETIHQDIADVRKEARRMGVTAKQMAGAEKAYAEWDAETWPARAAAIRERAKANRSDDLEDIAA